MRHRFDLNIPSFIACSKQAIFYAIENGNWSCQLNIDWLFYSFKTVALSNDELLEILGILYNQILQFSLRFKVEETRILCKIKPRYKIITTKITPIGINSQITRLFFNFDTDCDFAVQLLEWYHKYPINNPLWFLFVNVHQQFCPALIYTLIHDNFMNCIDTIQEINPLFYIIILTLTLHNYSFRDILRLFPFNYFVNKCFYVYFLYLKKYLFNININLEEIYPFLDKHPLLAVLFNMNTTKKNKGTIVDSLMLNRTNALVKRLNVYNGDIVNTIVNFVECLTINTKN